MRVYLSRPRQVRFDLSTRELRLITSLSRLPHCSCDPITVSNINNINIININTSNIINMNILLILVQEFSAFSNNISQRSVHVSRARVSKCRTRFCIFDEALLSRVLHFRPSSFGRFGNLGGAL